MPLQLVRKVETITNDHIVSCVIPMYKQAIAWGSIVVHPRMWVFRQPSVRLFFYSNRQASNMAR